MSSFLQRFKTFISSEVSIAPLVLFRLCFGLLLFISVTRFWLNGWIDSLYIRPEFHFGFEGFEWIKVPSPFILYSMFFLMMIASLFIAAGFLYRISTILFFLIFSYIELIDKTPYLNHYYFISVISFLMIFLPAAKYFSLDVRFKIASESKNYPRFFLLVIQFQIAIVYFFAGLAKLNSDWLFEAQPLKIWLEQKKNIPIAGTILSTDFTAYLFSYAGCIFDLSIAFFLFSKRWNRAAYFFVIVFHSLTALLFNIGLFPYVMMVVTLIFLDTNWHENKIEFLNKIISRKNNNDDKLLKAKIHFLNGRRKLIIILFLLHFVIQLFIPMRYLFYGGNVLWHEQGFRFSWRVMLINKTGTITFIVKDNNSNAKIHVNSRNYLTAFQDSMMRTQSDMILQFANFLATEFEGKTVTVNHKNIVFQNPEIYVNSFVTLNAHSKKRFISQYVNLANYKKSSSYEPLVLDE